MRVVEVHQVTLRSVIIELRDVFSDKLPMRAPHEREVAHSIGVRPSG